MLSGGSAVAALPVRPVLLLQLQPQWQQACLVGPHARRTEGVGDDGSCLKQVVTAVGAAVPCRAALPTMVHYHDNDESR